MGVTTDLFINAIIAGILLGGFYAAVTIGISISFGILDIVNIAHPAFVILGSYIAYLLNVSLGIDPILASVVALPAFFALGMAVYQLYYSSFDDHLPHRYVVEHEDIIAAIEARDVEAADRLASAHADQIVRQIQEMIARDRRQQIAL